VQIRQRRCGRDCSTSWEPQFRRTKTRTAILASSWRSPVATAQPAQRNDSRTTATTRYFELSIHQPGDQGAGVKIRV
jgi:hypothetical protein